MRNACEITGRKNSSKQTHAADLDCRLEKRTASIVRVENLLFCAVAVNQTTRPHIVDDSSNLHSPAGTTSNFA
jgi:hypothetical protein